VSKVSKLAPVRSQSVLVASLEAEARSWLSRENTTELTEREWYSNVARRGLHSESTVILVGQAKAYCKGWQTRIWMLPGIWTCPSSYVDSYVSLVYLSLTKPEPTRSASPVCLRHVQSQHRHLWFSSTCKTSCWNQGAEGPAAAPQISRHYLCGLTACVDKYPDLGHQDPPIQNLEHFLKSLEAALCKLHQETIKNKTPAIYILLGESRRCLPWHD